MPRKSSGRNGSYRRSCRESSTARLWTREGEFLELPSIVTAAVYELFRRLLVLRLHQEERPTERFMENLLSWVHSRTIPTISRCLMRLMADRAYIDPESTSCGSGGLSRLVTLP